MSHFAVIVITPPSSEPFEDLLAKQLQPYHEYECTGTNDEYVQDVDVTEECREKGIGWHGLEERVVSDESQVERDGAHRYGYAVMDGDKVVKAVNRTNPNAKWDWWQVGGRYSKRLMVHGGAKVDSAKKGEIDFPAMEREKAANATHEWNVAQTIIDGTEPNEPWASVRERIKDNDAARAFYKEQPRVKKWQEGAWNHDLFGFFSNAEEYAVPLVEFLSTRCCPLTGFAVVKDGQWFERGKMGWWACVSNEKDGEQWQKEFDKLIYGLPEDHTITVVDCHI